MCGMLILVASINFLIDPKVVPGRAGLLVTMFLVLTTFFSDAQVKKPRECKNRVKDDRNSNEEVQKNGKNSKYI